MTDKLKQQIEKAATALKNRGASAVYLFGSAATNMMRENSDLDFAVSGLPEEKYFDAMADAIHAAGCEIDLVDLDEDNPFTHYLKSKGELKRVA